jgi:hypothetical protein
VGRTAHPSFDLPGCRHGCSVRLPLGLHAPPATYQPQLLGTTGSRVGSGILALEPTLKVDFSRASGALHRATNDKVRCVSTPLTSDDQNSLRCLRHRLPC